MIVKAGVNYDALRPPAWFAMGYIKAAFAMYAHSSPVRLTSGTEGQHMPQSKHYEGLAVDIGTRGLSTETEGQIVAFLRATLDPLGFDTFAHGEGADHHLHCEFDPKPGEVWLTREKYRAAEAPLQATQNPELQG